MSRAQQFEIFAAGALYLGVPVPTGYARFYAAGTTTLKNAYEDKAKAVSCTTKTLDAEGRAEVYGDGIYKIRIYEGDPDDGGTLRVEIDDYKCTAVEGDVTTVTANYTVDRDDRLVLVNSTSGNITISFDSVTTFDNPVTIKKTSASNTVTLDPYSTQLIDTDSTLELTENNQTVTLEPDTTAAIWRRTNHVAAGVVGVSGDVVGTTDTQTLTNKTLTSPKVNEDVELAATSTELDAASTYIGNLTAIASEVNTASDGIANPPIAGDSTAGRVLRVGELHIEDATTASLVKLQYYEVWPSTVTIETDNVPDAGGSFTGNFKWISGATTNQIQIEASALQGNNIRIVSASIAYNDSGTSITVLPTYTITNVICLNFYPEPTDAAFNFGTLVDTGAIKVIISYICSA